MPDREWFRKEYSRRLGQLYSLIPALAHSWGRRFEAERGGQIGLVRLQKPLSACRLALMTTGGVHLRTQPPFNMQDSRGDASFRIIPAHMPVEDLMITHDYYDHSDAERDINILLPIPLFRELEAKQHIAGLGSCYSFMGHIEPPHVETLLGRTAPEVAGLLRQEQIDAVLLTPA